jgi:hypothetical protein
MSELAAYGVGVGVGVGSGQLSCADEWILTVHPAQIDPFRTPLSRRKLPLGTSHVPTILVARLVALTVVPEAVTFQSIWDGVTPTKVVFTWFRLCTPGTPTPGPVTLKMNVSEGPP